MWMGDGDLVGSDTRIEKPGYRPFTGLREGPFLIRLWRINVPLLGADRLVSN